MKFFILFFCFLLQAVFGVTYKKDKYDLLDRYANGMKPLLTKFNLMQGWGAVLGLLVPILIIVLLLNAIFIHNKLLYLIYGILILLLCLDIRDMKKQLTDYFTAYANENLVKAQVEAERFVQHSVHQDKHEMTRAVTEAIFVRSLTQVFAVIFWFMLFGPFGAVLYYVTAAILSCSLRPEFGYSDTFSTATYLKEILDWLPVRVLTLTFALLGHFGPVFNLWVDRIGGGLTENRQMLVDSGLTAINADLVPSQSTVIENHNALSLVNRTLWTWFIIIAVLTIASWL